MGVVETPTGTVAHRATYQLPGTPPTVAYQLLALAALRVGLGLEARCACLSSPWTASAWASSHPGTWSTVAPGQDARRVVANPADHTTTADHGRDVNNPRATVLIKASDTRASRDGDASVLAAHTHTDDRFHVASRFVYPMLHALRIRGRRPVAGDDLPCPMTFTIASAAEGSTIMASTARITRIVIVATGILALSVTAAQARPIGVGYTGQSAANVSNVYQGFYGGQAPTSMTPPPRSAAS